MTYENKPFVPQTFKQIKKEYMETPFWLGKFMPGSQLTIVEDLPTTKTFRYVMKPSNKGGPAYPVNLIRISDGYVEKDLELSKTNTQMLLVNLPDNIINLKGVTLANDMGRWVFVSQTREGDNSNFPKSAQIAASMEPAPVPQMDQKDLFVEQLVHLMRTNDSKNTGVNETTMISYCRNITPGDAIGLITYAKLKGAIYEQGGAYKAV